LDWAMEIALNVYSPKKQIYISRLNEYACCYLFTIFIAMVLPFLWILKIRLIEHISLIPFFIELKNSISTLFTFMGSHDVSVQNSYRFSPSLA